MKKRIVKWFLTISLVLTGMAAFTSETQAAYSPYSVESSVKNAWNNGTAQLGSKSSSWTSGKRIVYDVYSQKFDKNGYSIVTGDFDGEKKKYLRFYGWSVLAGHKHHTSSNQSTHIVLKKVGSNTTKIYGTKQGTWDATKDLEYNSQGSGLYNRCPNSAINKNNLDCNMEYNDVTFTAYIPLDDLFEEKFDPAQWAMYLVKRVDKQIVYTPLIVPFDFNEVGFNGGKVGLTSGVDANKLRMNDYPVLRRDYPRQPAKQTPSLYFKEGSYYTRIDSDESDTAIWYGVSYGGTKKWANTTYWTFGGDQAVLKYVPPYPNLYGGDTLIQDKNGKNATEFEYGEPVTIRGYAHSDTKIGNVNHTHLLNGKSQGNIRTADYPDKTGSTRIITKTYTDLMPGTYKVKAHADYDNKIKESNKADNYSKEVTFKVKPRNLYGAETKVYNVDNQEQYKFEVGDTVRVKGNIKADAPIETVNHTHILNGKMQGNVQSIDYMDTRSRWISKDYKNLPPGSYEVYAFADYDDRIKESNEDDNYSSKATFTIQNTNLTAQSIELLSKDRKPVKFLTKGEEYVAKVIYQNTGETTVNEHQVSLESGNSTLSTVSVGKLAPGSKRTTYIDFSPVKSGKQLFTAFVDSKNEIRESNEDDNKVSTNIHVNTKPEITISYTPAAVYEGDKVNVCIVPTDEDNDPLKVTIEMDKRSTGYKQVHSQTGLKSGQKICYVIDKAEVGKYSFKGTVDDGYNDAEATISFTAQPLTIRGEVNHTATWLKRHLESGNDPSEFYSGEKFLLIAHTTKYPISNLTVKMDAKQEKGSSYTPTINIKPTNTGKHEGEHEDPSLLEPGTTLKSGPVTFEFRVVYQNGVVKTDKVTIQIIGDVYDLFKLHRKY